VKDIKLKISDRLHGKIKEASAVVGKSTDVLMREFLEESADIVLNGNFLEVDAADFDKFKESLEKKPKVKKT